MSGDSAREITCHPAVHNRMTTPDIRSNRVVVDGSIVTSQGPATAIEFALVLIELVDGKEAAERVATGLVMPT